MPRESLDAPEDLPKQALRQVASGKPEGEGSRAGRSCLREEGDTVGYWLGRLGGLPLLERYGGGKTAFFGRFVAFLRQ